MGKTDAQLKKELKYQKRMLALCEERGQEWTAAKFRQMIEYTQNQLDTPRNWRLQYQVGKL